MQAVSTFSLVARDPENGDLGVVTASKFLAVGAVVPFAKAGVGAVATQSYANTSFGPRTIRGLEQKVPLELLQRAFEQTDTQHAMRQYGLVDAAGNSVTFTGADCHPWAGGKRGPGYAAQGNLLTGPEVVEALVGAYLSSSAPFPERLVEALAAGDDAGGDKRGRQSAALLVVREGGGYAGFNDRYIDLRVDDHEQPVAELRRLLALQRLYFGSVEAADILDIRDEVNERLQATLVRSGHLAGVSADWNAEAEQALRALAGTENLEERLLESGSVDRKVLEMLEAKYR